MVYYQIKMHGKYMQGISPNSAYNRTGIAPIMGNRHIPAEFKSMWDKEPKEFEPLTMANYIKVITEEFRWKNRKPADIKIIPVEK